MPTPDPKEEAAKQAADKKASALNAANTAAANAAAKKSAVNATEKKQIGNEAAEQAASAIKKSTPTPKPSSDPNNKEDKESAFALGMQVAGGLNKGQLEKIGQFTGLNKLKEKRETAVDALKDAVKNALTKPPNTPTPTAAMKKAESGAAAGVQAAPQAEKVPGMARRGFPKEPGNSEEMKERPPSPGMK